MKTHLLVIGGASTDLLHTASGKVTTAGGAGMYTAMAAWRCGVQVSLFAPRPQPLPEALSPVSARLAAWLGPVIPPEALAHFEISYQDGQTTYLEANVGAETALTPSDLQDDLSQYGCIHIIPLGATNRQLDFVRACRQRGVGRISVGNHLAHIQTSPALVSQIIAEADICFMNDKEAAALFGSVAQAHTQPGKVLYVTLGADGCLVIEGEQATRLATHAVKALDPTGAGDTFCGAALAALMAGAAPVQAALFAMPLAAQMTQHLGPAALFWSEPPPESLTWARNCGGDGTEGS